MKTNDQLLLKHFSSVLRNRANGNHDLISTSLLKFLSRKDLVEVIKKIHKGNIPKELDLSLMENEELLQVIQDEMYVISFMTERWSGESQQIIKNSIPILKKKDTNKSNSVSSKSATNNNSKKKQDEKK